MKKILLLFVLLCDSGINVFSQAFINYTRFNSPLPDNHCKSHCHNRTADSLSRYDGIAIFNDTTWTVYTTVNSGISDNSIKAIRFDAAGNAWISTQTGGVNKFDGTTFTIFNTTNSGIASDYSALLTLTAMM